MAGNGRIGGGGSCWLNFIIEHEDGTKERWSAHDECANVGVSKVTVKFPGTPHDPITVDLKTGTTVEITWT